MSVAVMEKWIVYVCIDSFFYVLCENVLLTLKVS
jgi:hypothetical protein